MNISAILGLGLAAIIIWLGAIGPSAHPGIFLDPHAILLVVGGTLAAALIGFPIKRLWRIIDFFVMGVVLKNAQRESHIAAQIIELALLVRGGQDMNTIDVPESSHPFLAEAKSLRQRNMKDEDLEKILEDRITHFRMLYLADARMLSALAKFPPAFGLLGASAGMIAMMSNLHTGGAEKIGPAMAVALVATFWGIGLANFVMLPLADYAMRSVAEDARKRRLIADGIMLSTSKMDIRTLVERLAGQMSLDDRLQFYEIVRAKHMIQAAKPGGPRGSSAA